MPPITTRLGDGWARALEHLPLSAVPLVTAALATDRMRQILSADGGHLGIRFGLPVDVVDVWTFVSVPNEGVNVEVGLPVGLPLAVVLVPVAVVLRAALGAGYFGSIRGALETGNYEFAANARRHFVPFLLYTVAPLLATLPLFVLAAGGGARALLPVAVILFPAVLLLSYLFYATPYLVVLRETDVVSAARASYSFAVAGGPYARYAVGFGGFVLAASLVVTAIVVNLGPVGIALGVGGGAAMGLACNVATMRFVADIDPASPSLGTGFRWARPGA